MKALVALFVLSLFYGCQEEPKNGSSLAEPSQASLSQGQPSDQLGKDLPKELQDPEDCDEKAKKAEDKKVEVVNLGSNDEGCSLE